VAKGRSSRHDRDRPLGRRRPTREPVPRILVVCEGEVTEARYLDEFRRWEKNALVTVVIDSRSAHPKTLVERALRQRDEAEESARRQRDVNLRFDEAWCVFDVDEHASLDAVEEEARRHGIRLAISNPCFELWALLHFQDHGAHTTCADLARQLRQHLPTYQKELPFAKLASGYEAAVGRARALERRHEDAGTPGENPSTGVHHLTERIRQFGREERLSGRSTA
jgi:hypothetical protein